MDIASEDADDDLDSASNEEIVAVVEEIITSLRGDLTAPDLPLYRELENLAVFIREAKSEIAEMRPDEITSQHIPQATDELDAIVAATEEATGTILDAVESVENLTSKIPDELAREIETAATRIYEACNFQDITGQRISKVVNTLKHIESKLNALVETFGVDLPEGRADRPEEGEATGESRKPSDDIELLHGPQLPDQAISQEDIDALLAG